MLYSLLADVVVVLHLLFVAFVLFGGLLVQRWPLASWVHLPTVLWAALIELFGWVCPLTPLENWLRGRAGGRGYEGGFVEHYIIPVLYPGELTREIQVVLAAVVIVVNVVVYALVLRRRPMV